MSKKRWNFDVPEDWAKEIDDWLRKVGWTRTTALIRAFDLLKKTEESNHNGHHN